MAKQDLTYRITADTKGLTQAIGRAKPEFERLAKTAEKTAASIQERYAQSFRAIAAGAAAMGAAVVAAVGVQLSEIDRVQKAADSLGVSFAEVAAAELAVSRGGADWESMARALSKAAAAAQGTQTALEVFGEWADEIAALGPGAAATARAIELLGERGRKLVPVLLGGSAGLREAARDAERYGLVVGEQAARATETLNDRLGDFRAIGTGFARQLTGEIAPSLSAYATQMLEAAESSTALRDAIDAIAVGVRVVVTLFEGLSTAARLVASVVQSAARVMAAAALHFRDLFEAVASGDPARVLDAWTTTARRQWGNITGLFEDLQSEINASHSRMSAIWSGGEGSDDDGGFAAFGPTPAQLAQLAEARMQAQSSAHAKRLDQTRREAEEYDRLWTSAMKQSVEDGNAEWAAAAEQLRAESKASWDAWTSDLLKDFDEMQGAFDAADAARAEADAAWAASLQASIDEVAQAFDARAQQMRTIASTVGSGIADALFGPAEQSLDDLLRKWGEMVARMLLTQGVSALVGGGAAVGFARGGYVSGPGTSTSDSVPARLSRGEYVMSAAAVEQHGRAFFDRLNGLVPKGYAAGGAVSGGEVVVVQPSTEAELQRFLATRRGQRIILAATRDVDRAGGR